MTGSPGGRFDLSPKRRRLLESMLREEGIGTVRAAGIPMRPPGAPPVLSPGQQGLWFLDQWEGKTPLYHIPIVARLSGALDVDLMERTLQEIVRRHETLRTTFALDGETVRPVTGLLPEKILRVVDLRATPAEDCEVRALRLATEEVRRPFDLSRGPLFRITIVQVDETTHLLVMVMHHIIADGWSTGVLLREMEEFYAALAEGRPARLPEIPYQYTDFAWWSRERLQGEPAERLLLYWKSQLTGSPLALDLPTDRPRPPVETHRGALASFVLPPDLLLSLHDLSRREGVTLFMTLLATFQALLHRYSGQSRIPVGTPIANRDVPQSEGLVGYFVNTLVLCTDLSGDPTFIGLLRRVREVTLGAFAHQDLPFEKLVEHLEPPRDMSRHPLFQVMLVFQNVPLPELRLRGLKGTWLDADTATSRFDLNLTLIETSEGLRGTMEYSTELFSATTIRRMIRHFHILLEAVVTRPEQRISRMPLLDDEERRLITVGWNAGRGGSTKGISIRERFEEQAGRTPDSPAIRFEGRDVSYRDLEDSADRWAGRLGELGVGPEVRVGLCAARSPGMVAALMGILKAGGVYVPLPPDLPRERLAFLLRDAGVELLIRDASAGADRPDPESGCAVLEIGREPESSGEGKPLTFARPVVTPDTPAYLIYTSGSTGTPKGILGLNGATLNRFEWMWWAYPFGPGEVACQKTSIGFVDSIWEILGPLLKGVPSVIIPDPVVKDPRRLVETLADEGVTRIVLVPSLLRAILDCEEDLLARLPKLRQWIASGEALGIDLARRFKKAMPHAVLLNLYGSSEVSADATYYEVGDCDGLAVVPIGRPIPNCTAYILDPHLEPNPIGVRGDLYIGGAGLARGYLGRPGLTALAFLPDPFSDRPGGRMYRTGDLARHTEDGMIEFLGRSDHQVKIRGVRVEPGEIEAVLSRHPGVFGCAVVAADRAGEGMVLVAYYVSKGATDLDPGVLKSYLKQKLPEVMVPSTFVKLAELPLNPSGKLDRLRLPPPGPGRPELRIGYVAPASPAEEILALIWSDLLGVDGIGVNDNFFELGGHSLLAAQFVSRVRRQFMVELPLRAFFEGPTVAELARRLATVRDREALPLARLPREGPPPRSFAQERLWFLDQLAPGNPAYNLSSTVRFAGGLDGTALERSLAEIVKRHEVLRTTFAERAGRPVQVIGEGGGLGLRQFDLARLAPAAREVETRRLVIQNAREPFDLAGGPLLRAALLRLDAEDHLLQLTMHHIVADHWSAAVFMRELSALYNSFAKGEPSPLPELPIQYADFALWQRDGLGEEDQQELVDYWMRQLGDDLPTLDLPLDHPRQAAQTFRGDVRALELSPELTKDLTALCRSEGVTLFMTLLAGFQALLHRYTGQSDIIVGTDVANRTRAEIEPLIGFFVNQLVLRVDLAGNPTFRELIRRVRQVAFGAYAHQQMPFERLVAALKPRRDPSRTPLFQVIFDLRNAPMPALAIPGVELTFEDVHNGTAKYDMVWNLAHTGRQLAGVVEYNADLFTASTIGRWIDHYRMLLAAVAQDPEQRIANIPLHETAEIVAANAAPLIRTPDDHEQFNFGGAS